MRAVDRVSPGLGILLESPRVDEASGILSFVDGPTGRLFVAEIGSEPAEWTIVSHSTGFASLGAALPVGEGRYLLAGDNAIWRWDGAAPPEVVTRIEPRRGGMELNDAAIDPWGAVLVGEAHRDLVRGAGRLLRLSSAGALEVVASDLTLPNGIAWSPDAVFMYFAESVSRVVYRVPYSSSGPDWESRSVFLRLRRGMPDGVCVDRDGRVWIAVYGRGEILCLDADGDLVERVALPVSQVTSCLQLGEGLVVTTAAEDFDASAWRREPEAGSLFYIGPHDGPLAD